MIYAVLIPLSAVLGLAAGDTLCPDAWVAYNGSCYLFGFDQNLNFVEAEHFCSQHHGHLVEINDVHENNFLLNFLTHQNPVHWWIGLSDSVVEREYKWLTSDTFASYKNWAHGQPGSLHGHNEDCVIMDHNHGYHWSDIACTGRFYPLCEIRKSEEELGSIVG